MVWTIKLFDRLSIVHESGAGVRLPTRKAGEIVAWLILHGGQAQDRRRLRADLWPDEFDDYAVSSLRNHLHKARAAFRAVDSANDPFHADRDEVGFLDSRLESDWDRFWSHLSEAQNADKGRLDLLVSAADLYRGDLLRNEEWGWLAQYRRSAREAASEAALNAADLAMEAANASLAHRMLDFAAGFPEVIEAALERRIRLLMSQGREAEAREAHRRLVAAVGKEEASPWDAFAEIRPDRRLRKPPVAAGPALSEAERVALRSGAHNGSPVAAGLALRFRKPRTAWKTTSAALGLVAAGCIGVAAYRLARSQDWKPPETLDQAEQRLTALNHAPDTNATNRERSRVCAWVADQCWQQMWGPQEAPLSAQIARTWPSFEKAFHWSLKHDPETALRIIGSGHRVMQPVEGDDVCRQWLSDALAATPDEDTAARERALCGVSFFNWGQGHGTAEAGLAAAERAEQIAHRLKLPWDEANAVRHEGLCFQKEPGVTNLYMRALKSYEDQGDPRGEAMTMLSLAQRGNISGDRAKDDAEMAGWALRAEQAFATLGNPKLASQCLDYVSGFCPYLPQTAKFADLRRAARSRLWAAASAAKAAPDCHTERRRYCDCLEIDEELNDQGAVVADLHQLLTPLGIDFNDLAYDFLEAAYTKASHQLGLQPDPACHANRILKSEDAAFQRGLSANPKTILEVARKFDSPGMPI